MAQVPYNPTPTVSTEIAPTPDRSVAGVSAAAFGGDVAQSLEGMGKVVSNVGDELWGRAVALQKLNNEAEAQNAEAEYTIQAGELSAKYNSLQGLDAINGREKYITDLRALRERMTAGMTNPDTKRQFAQSSLGTLSRLTLYSATHAATENRKYLADSADAQFTGTLNGLAQTPNDEAAKAAAKAAALRSAARISAIKGYDIDQTGLEATKRLSLVSRTEIEATLRDDPFKAKEQLDAQRRDMTADDIKALEPKIDERQMQVGAARIEQSVNADLKTDDPTKPERTLAQRKEAARKEAERLRPGDELFIKRVELEVSGGYARRTAELKDADFRNTQIIGSALLGEVGGKVPTTLAELRALGPGFSDAYDGLNVAGKNRVQVKLAQNAHGDVIQTPATEREYMRVRGMAVSGDPDEVEKFLYMDTAALNIPRSQATQLGKMQQDLKNNPAGNLAVNKAYRQLADAGIAPTLSNGTSDDILVYRGVLHEALNLWQQENKGKVPTWEDTKKIGQRLWQDTEDPERFGWSKNNMFGFGRGGKDSKYFRLQTPEVFKEERIRAAQAVGDPVPTDMQLARDYIAWRYRLQYGAQKAQPK